MDLLDVGKYFVAKVTEKEMTADQKLGLFCEVCHGCRWDGESSISAVGVVVRSMKTGRSRGDQKKMNKIRRSTKADITKKGRKKKQREGEQEWNKVNEES